MIKRGFVESADEFSRNLMSEIPKDFNTDYGYFNVFKRENYQGPMEISYGYRDFYAISLINGPTRVHYGSEIVKFEKSALLITNPHVPYSWELLSDRPTGFCCVFSEKFIDHFKYIKDYPIFRSDNIPVFNLVEHHIAEASNVYLKMLTELNSEFTYKYDVLGNLILELIYNALKIDPELVNSQFNSNGSLRLSSLFMSLLEGQFPILSPKQRIRFRHPMDYANELYVHVNHLNRSLKEINGKSTSGLISERIMSEARRLLSDTDWNISEIALCLGFDVSSHFTNFFKKNENMTPMAFRRIHIGRMV